MMDILNSIVDFYDGWSISLVLPFVAPRLSRAHSIGMNASASAEKPPRTELSPEPLFRQPAEPLTAAMQWTRVAAVLTGAAQATVRVRDLHASAMARLDMADYALGRLMEDVARFMPPPEVVTPTHRRKERPADATAALPMAA